jgi:HD-like signal output (HDOD) protein/CheY-like chemotaxis protein
LNDTISIKPGRQKHPAIIIVDDEEAILMSLRSLFRKDNYSMFLFSSPLKAIEFLEKNYVDLIITDMRMPEMSGAELLERSAAICPMAIRLIISGYEEKATITRVLSSGLARHFIMKPWDDAQLKQFVTESMELQEKLKQKHLEDILSSFRYLPSPPKMHNKLKIMLSSEQVSQKDIANEIENNPELVANLLRMANSIYYGTRKSISSIIEALNFIGTDSVLNMILSLEVFDCLCSSAAKSSFQRVLEIREKSVERAHIAKRIAQYIYPGADLQDAFVAALMLDIGLIFRCSSSPHKYDTFYEEYKVNGKQLYSADKNVFAVTHDEVGEALLTYWNFSPSIISAVANHHRYINNADSLSLIVQTADKIVQEDEALPRDPKVDGLYEKVIDTLKETTSPELPGENEDGTV